MYRHICNEPTQLYSSASNSVCNRDISASGEALNAMSLTGKAFVTMAFHGIYIFSAETFPTEVRHVGMGTASVCARIGGMIAPYMGPPMVFFNYI